MLAGAAARRDLPGPTRPRRWLLHARPGQPALGLAWTEEWRDIAACMGAHDLGDGQWNAEVYEALSCSSMSMGRPTTDMKTYAVRCVGTGGEVGETGRSFG